MNHGIVRPRHRPWSTWTAAPGTIVTTALVDDPDERDGMTLDEMEQAAENDRVPGTCPYCGVMSPFPHLSGCPRGR